MIKTYLTLSIRSLSKSPLFSVLNLFGLALGLTVSLLLFMHVRQELSFDRYNRNEARIYRVLVDAFWDPQKPETLANAPNAVAPAMKAHISGVEQSARVLKHEFGESAFITAGTEKLVEKNVYWVDPSLFDIFDVPVIAGDLKSGLSNPNTVALSKSTALRYFGSADVLGRTIAIDRLPPLEVKAVFEDFPGNSSFDAHVFGSFQTIRWASERLVWTNASFETWALLAPGTGSEQVEKQLAAELDRNVPKAEQRFALRLQPLRDVHLYSSAIRSGYASNPGDPQQVGILAALALAVLLIACFNYMNLSTARAQLRYREVGINKTMGATRRQLAFRFYAETALLTGAATILALGMLYAAIPMFNQLAGQQLDQQALWQPQTLLAVLTVMFLVVAVAGSYPALYLSGFSPKNLLQTTFRKESGAGFFRRSLVTAQFTASVALIIGSIVLYRQMQFIHQKQLGFDPEQVVAITTVAADNREQIDALIQDCQNLSGVKAVCRAQTFPGNKASGRTLVRSSEDTEGHELLTNRVTTGFEKVLGVKFIAGAGLPERTPEDTIVDVVINRTALEYLGITAEEAIGKKIQGSLGDNSYIRGVVEDFNAESLHRPMTGYAFHNAPFETRRFLLVKMSTGNLSETMGHIREVFQKSLPQSAFEYEFLDEHLDALYRREQRTASTVLVFSCISVFICSLGLFGLAAFAAERRTKEIGIRKVLGASVSSVLRLLVRDFVRLVGVAIVLAAPIAGYLMQKWLSDFAYRIDLQWWMFAAAGALAVSIAVLTVAFQSLRAAVANPVQSLRHE